MPAEKRHLAISAILLIAKNVSYRDTVVVDSAVHSNGPVCTYGICCTRVCVRPFQRQILPSTEAEMTARPPLAHSIAVMRSLQAELDILSHALKISAPTTRLDVPVGVAGGEGQAQAGIPHADAARGVSGPHRLHLLDEGDAHHSGGICIRIKR